MVMEAFDTWISERQDNGEAGGIADVENNGHQSNNKSHRNIWCTLTLLLG